MTEKTTNTDLKRQEIWAEVEQWKKNPPKDKSGRTLSWTTHLNNFITRIPNPKYSSGTEFGESWEKSGDIDKKHELLYGPDNTEGRSQLFLSQTPRQFSQTIVEVIKNTPGLDPKKLKEFYDQYDATRGMPINVVLKSMENLYDYALPLYVELRVKGYSLYDLSS